ncbi:GNAT family N-acetyltransferase [Luteipulveratus sp. YIM 133132]|uniref:GNAT family N-acetyltransferase n=1 Tax=Luteipulveratus flavus TaxID=3031728 RepID=UPI0023B0CC4A|nr:GNAT family N-acetyltransferase [Luteipulveratus sp. YIM 133132]MDE9367155.1 GNAT family N-acetyltransferase [Luteipulveratus sp. YIM 133132]
MSETYGVLYEIDDRRWEQLATFYFDQWWTRDRDPGSARRALRGSEVVALVDAQDSVVAFARIVTDGAVFGWVGDVMVRDDVRGTGVGALLMDAVVAHPVVAALDTVSLECRPAMDGFYARWGFRDPAPSHVLRRVPR